MTYLERGNLIGLPIGALTFIGTWIFCIYEYGFLLGVGLGWLASLITAVFVWGVICLTWPVLLLAVGGVAVTILVSM